MGPGADRPPQGAFSPGTDQPGRPPTEGPPIKGFVETSFVDWDGRVAAVLFLPGCNFRCPYCHNHALISDPDQFETIPLAAVLSRLGAFGPWLDGVCVTGGEPTLHPRLFGLLEALKDAGLAVKLDTNGSRPDVIAEVLARELVDHVALDLKMVLEPAPYALLAGPEADVLAVSRSIDIVAKSPSAELRTTVVPGLHDDNALDQMAGYVPPGLKWRLQNFRPDNAFDPEFRRRKPFTEEEFAALVRMAQGLRPETVAG
ncbi:MAG: anaerobic ribonucleoside-triphosphate reductase activating protein [Proteobacteria bacterium]|nr:anaerobic ribonucleoside-triphosphate reductase activating protein [Pseudomonadota bacterium]MBU1741580.1 anaerobic ribonucleoside-triphosphate reductase activating protein [Pseudomonadota bacterium]